MGNSQACESRAPAPPTKKPGRVPWALLDSKRANARFSSEATREKSVEMDAVCAKLFPDGAEAKHAKSTVEGFSARLAQTAGSPNPPWRDSRPARRRRQGPRRAGARPCSQSCALVLPAALRLALLLRGATAAAARGSRCGCRGCASARHLARAAWAASPATDRAGRPSREPSTT